MLLLPPAECAPEKSPGIPPAFSECARDFDCADALEATLDLCLAGACVHIDTTDDGGIPRRGERDRGLRNGENLIPPTAGQCRDENFVPRGSPCGTNELCGYGACDGEGNCVQGPACVRRRSDVQIIANVLIGTIIALVAIAFVVSFAVSELFREDGGGPRPRRHFSSD